MKYTERFFRFPVKLYLTKDLQKKDDLEERLGIELSKDEEEEEIEFVVGWEAIDVEQIFGYGTIFSRNKTLEDVRRDGFDSTIVYLREGREIGCSWPPKVFEEKLNKFVEKLEEEAKRLEQEEEETQEQLPWYKRWFSKVFK